MKGFPFGYRIAHVPSFMDQAQSGTRIESNESRVDPHPQNHCNLLQLTSP